MEEATYRGVSVNATVSFSVAQALAAGEAVERGLRRREAEGLPVDDMGPVITMMMGRLEDWLRVQTERDGIVVDPARCRGPASRSSSAPSPNSGPAACARRPLGAAIRHHLHWSELIGGDVVITLPAVWQRRFNASSVEVRPRMDDPVDPAIVDELRRASRTSFARYEPDGLTPEEFDAFGPSARTLRAFIGSYHELLHQVDDALVPNPDFKPALVTDGRRDRSLRPHPAGRDSLAEGGWSVVLTPETAGWRFSGLRAATLAAGASSLAFDTGADEVAVLSLAGELRSWTSMARRTGSRVGPASGPGRATSCTRRRDGAIEVGSAGGGRFAVATARAERRFPVRYVAGDRRPGRAPRRRRLLPRGAQLRGGRTRSRRTG